MLVLKSSGIDLSKSETKTILGFFFLYSFLVLVILGVISLIYYKFQQDLMLHEKRLSLQDYSNYQIANLKELHVNIDKTNIYPRDSRFNSAIYDKAEKEIFSTLKNKEVMLDEVIYLKNGYIHLIKEPESYYLGSKYVIVEIEDDRMWFEDIKYKMLGFFIVSFLFMQIIGYFIAKLFLKPMRNSLRLLDRFIKDTTHELNTPVTAILSNIEMIDKKVIDGNLLKKINRIEIGAKTLSNIYEDLTFIALNNHLISTNKELDFSTLLEQRVEFFEAISSSKKIKIFTQIEKNIKIVCDEKKLSKLIDNLLSNAIKYNKFAGFIRVVLKDNTLSIEDSGIGISKENIKNLFQRYTRFDTSLGGFGIGLNIVYMIAKEYNFEISIDSKLDEGTRIEIKW